MKRILALDGGGIRGIFSLQILKKIEASLRQMRSNENLVLADEFHCFAGTSTGAIIATGLSWGMSVQQIEALYVEHGAEMFARAPWYRRFHSKYRAESIADFFRRFFNEGSDSNTPALLGTSRLRTLLILVMRNATTGAPWPLSNNPQSLFNDRARPDCNLNIPLWQLLRASTAAPSFFPPQDIEIGAERYLFVDGAVTPFNNPALLAVLMTTLPSYRVGWKTGREDLHVISVGTGNVRTRMLSKIAAKITLFDHLGHVIPALIGSAANQQDLLCRVLGDCLHGAVVDSEVGPLDHPTLLPSESQLFSYVRYEQDLGALPVRRLTRFQTAIDNVKLIPMLQELGQEYAEAHVRINHLFPRGPGEVAETGAIASLRHDFQP